MSRRASVATVLRSVGIRGPRGSAPVNVAAAAKLIDWRDCASHLFERAPGGKRCRWCGTPAPMTRGRANGWGSRTRACAPEKDVQRNCISLYVAIGCRYSAKHETDIYVLGTKRPRHLPGIAHRTFQTAGIGDLWVFLPLVARYAKPGFLSPRFVWHEVKAEDGTPSAAQERFQQQCLERGIAHVMGGVDQLKLFLIRHGFLREGA